jgi:hypothetical protein
MSGEQAQSTFNGVWNLFSLIGVPAFVSSVITVVLSYVVTMRQFRKRDRMVLVQDKLDLYSFFIYHLNSMKYTNDALAHHNLEEKKEERFAYTPRDWDSFIAEIDKRIGDRYFLLNPKILEQWVWAKTLRHSSESIDLMPELRKMLIEEYNQIIDNHLKDFSDIVPKIPHDGKGLDFPSHKEDINKQSSQG